MTIDFYKNISLVRLAGINRFIVIEFTGRVTRISLISNNDPVLKINYSRGLEKYSLLKSTVVQSDDPESLETELSKFCKDNGLENVYVICDLNKYRLKTVKVPLDSEDVEEWLDQNRISFLPEGSTPDQFTYSYEKLFSDDDFIYLLVSVSRIDHVNGLSELIQKNKLIPLAIFPFVLLLHTDKPDREIPRLVIQLNGDSLSYSYSDEKINIVTGEFSLPENASERLDAIRNNIYKLGMDCNLRKESGKKNPVEVILLADKGDNELLKKNVSEELVADVSDDYGSVNYNSVVPFSAVNKVEKDFDNLVNLEEADKLDKHREVIEKNITTRITLAAGAVLIVLLLLITMGEMFLAESIQKSNDKLVDYEAKQNLIETRQKENTKLKSDYAVLTELKSGKVVFPDIMKTVSEVLCDNCYLTDIKFQRDTDTKVIVQLEGVAKEQKYVTSFLGNLELNEKFSDAALLSSVIVNSSRVKYNPGLHGSELISFKIVSSYNVD